jgi:hypothetical protein
MARYGEHQEQQRHEEEEERRGRGELARLRTYEPMTLPSTLKSLYIVNPRQKLRLRNGYADFKVLSTQQTAC